MNTITVDKALLREKVEVNRALHRETFIEAMGIFSERYVATVQTYLDDAKNGLRYQLVIQLPMPEDHTKDYDRVLEMIDMSVGDTMDLEEDDVASYIQDDWGWKRAWMTNTASYTQRI